MGLLQMAVKTYDRHKQLIGEYQEGKEPLAPVGHVLTSAAIEITLNKEGNLCDARKVDKKEPKIIIPASEESASRTSTTIAPHPLCEQLGYLTPRFEEKWKKYMEALAAWNASEFRHEKLKPILTYVSRGSIEADLIDSKLIDPTKDATWKLVVRWRVVGLSEGEEACWKDKTLFEAFIRYTLSLNGNASKSLCMISGKQDVKAKNCPKGICSLHGNAKLISANDKTNFTYRGRFKEEWQAESVGYEATQKAHCALHWLISNQGVYFGNRAFLCWSPDGISLKRPTDVFLFNSDPVFKESDYRSKLKASLLSFSRDNQLTGNEDAVIASFDAATTGRLSLTYYRELKSSDFLQRLSEWDEHYCWQNGKFGIQSPYLPDIVRCAFGTQREEKNSAYLKADDAVMKQQLQRLLSCRIERAAIPQDIVKALANRASMPQAYEKNNRERILFIACATIKKHRYDIYKEEWSMALDESNTNRSYLFGRLLAIAEKVERDTYDAEEKREPNAVRMQSVFARRPMYAWRILEEQLNPYYRQLSPQARQFYKKLTGEILDKLDVKCPSLNAPLEDLYLLGYYNQRRALYRKKQSSNEEITKA